MVCGGSGEFVSWLTIATAYRNREYGEWLADNADVVDQILVRPAFALA